MKQIDHAAGDEEGVEMLKEQRAINHSDLFDFEVTPELRRLAHGFESIGKQVRSGWIPNALLADLLDGVEGGDESE